MTGQRTITTKILQNIAKLRPEISIDWVLTGQGEMFLVARGPQNTGEEEPPAYFHNVGGMLETLIRLVEDLGRLVVELQGPSKDLQP